MGDSSSSSDDSKLFQSSIEINDNENIEWKKNIFNEKYFPISLYTQVEYLYRWHWKWREKRILKDFYLSDDQK